MVRGSVKGGGLWRRPEGNPEKSVTPPGGGVPSASWGASHPAFLFLPAYAISCTNALFTSLSMSTSNFTTPELPAKGIIEPLGDDDRLLLSSYGEFLPVHERQTLIAEGHQQNSLYFVISGNLHVSTT